MLLWIRPLSLLPCALLRDLQARISQPVHSQHTRQPDRREEQAQHHEPRDPLNRRVIFGQMQHLIARMNALLRRHSSHEVQGGERLPPSRQPPHAPSEPTGF